MGRQTNTIWHFDPKSVGGDAGALVGESDGGWAIVLVRACVLRLVYARV